MKTKHLLLTGAFAFAFANANAAIRYVDANAPGGTQDGTSWSTAYLTLSAALGAGGLSCGDEIRLADGTYFADASTQSTSFNLPAGVSLKGGYEGYSGGGYDPETFITTLSGEINTAALSDNTQRIVVVNVSTSCAATIDGLTIKLAYADGGSSSDDGAAIWYSNTSTGELTVSRCKIESNFATSEGSLYLADGELRVNACKFTSNEAASGGAIFIAANNNSTIVDETFFRLNEAAVAGGALVVEEAALLVDLCKFESNVTTNAGSDETWGGSAIMVKATDDVLAVDIERSFFLINSAARSAAVKIKDADGVQLKNCLFDGNMNTTGTYAGAAMAVFDGDNTEVTNCTFVRNSLPSGALRTTIDCDANSSNFDIRNSIVWGNLPGGNLAISNSVNDVLNSDIKSLASYSFGGSTTNSIDSDPLFVRSTAKYQYMISRNSPCADAGEEDYASATDILERTRIFDVLGGTDDIDMGVFEAKVIYVDASEAGSETGLSWTNAFPTLEAGLSAASLADEVWVANGLYLPSGSDNPNHSFTIPTGMFIYGGFQGPGDDELTDAVPATYTTTLNGDVGANNAYRIVVADVSSDIDLVIDGFTITQGLAFGSGDDEKGAGIFYKNLSVEGKLTVNRCILQGNSAEVSGGAIYVDRGLIEIENTTFTSNTAADGAAIYLNEDVDLQMSNCIALSNVASDDGAIVYNKQTSIAKIGNLEARCNTASGYGGMFYAEGAEADFYLANIMGTGNTASNDGNIYFSNWTSGGTAPTMELYHGTFFNNGTSSGTLFKGLATSSVVSGDGYVESTVFYQNTTTTFDNGTSDYSIAYSLNTGSGGQEGTGMLRSEEDEPEFVGTEGGCEAVDLRLTNASALIDMANPTRPADFADVDNDASTTSLPWDLDLFDRVFGEGPDIGAYEYGSSKRNNEAFVMESGSVFPNPTSGNLTVMIDNPIKNVMIYNISGQLQTAGVNINDAQATVDMSGLASGMYFVKVSDGTQQYNYKVEKH